MNWDFIHQYLPLYQKAAVLTLQIGVLGILASIAIGIVCTMIQYFKVPFVRKAVSVYVEISRNTPLLIQLFFIYYGLPKIGIRTNPYACGKVEGAAWDTAKAPAEESSEHPGAAGSVSAPQE